MEIKPTFNLIRFLFRSLYLFCTFIEIYTDAACRQPPILLLYRIVIRSIRNIIKIQMITIKIQL